MSTFRNQYKPLEHLLQTLHPYHSEHHRPLRNDLLRWASAYYDLTSEDSTAVNLDRKLSEDFDGLPVSNGGNLTLPGLVFLLERAELITIRNEYRHFFF